MKRVLITGANSYVGTHVEAWLMREPDKYYVETLDMKDSNWKTLDFSSFDVVFHVAGIAHVSTKKNMKDLYFKVNRDLAIETAKKAKESGVKQFIFMSSMIVYSTKETRITKDTIPNPDNFYGESKLQAEKGIIKIESEDFKVCILRPPMIYGPKSKGNFPKLIKYATKAFIFPKFKNSRSMLYIDNLSNAIKIMIDRKLYGYFFPQNSEYVSTYQIVKLVSEFSNKKILFTKFFNFLIILLRNKVNILNKMFSNFYYEFELSNDLINCSTKNLESSLMEITKSENHE